MANMRTAKKAKRGQNGAGTTPAGRSDLTLPPAEQVAAHAADYANAVPYKYAAVGGLISDDLVRLDLPALPSL
jgi:hypothetical protein